MFNKVIYLPVWSDSLPFGVAAVGGRIPASAAASCWKYRETRIRALLMLALVLAAINLRPDVTSTAPLIERIAEELALSRGLIERYRARCCAWACWRPGARLAVRFGLERTIACCLALIMLALLLRVGGHLSPLLIGSAVLLGTGIAVAEPLLSGFIKRHRFRDQVVQVVGWYSFQYGHRWCRWRRTGRTR